MENDRIECGDEWLSLVHRQHGEREVHVVKAGDEVLFVPLTDDGRVVFTVEPSPALAHNVLILPGGEMEDDEIQLDAGNRELQEEIGYLAERITYLATMHPWSKYLTVVTHVYLARDLKPSRLEGDEDYDIGIKRIPLNGFEKLIASGQLTDARVIAALYLAKRYLHWESGRRGLVEY
jgi:ADP-ribose diphosphatase